MLHLYVSVCLHYYVFYNYNLTTVIINLTYQLIKHCDNKNFI